MKTEGFCKFSTVVEDRRIKTSKDGVRSEIQLGLVRPPCYGVQVASEPYTTVLKSIFYFDGIVSVPVSSILEYY